MLKWNYLKLNNNVNSSFIYILEYKFKATKLRMDKRNEEMSFKSQGKNELLIIGDENVSLQNSFAKFLEKKKAEKRFQKQNAAIETRSDEYKAALRLKFIDRAKSYIGVPYHEKYQPEGSPSYPLYLDCCGLVRQVVTDLRDDFGFVIGKWNQVICT
jgi:hypothetical protein